MATVWLLQDGEPLPIDEAPRLLRTGNLAHHLVERGHEVVWFASVINHARHHRRPQGRGVTEVSDASYHIVLLQGLTYRGNLSPLRVISQALGAADFLFQCRKLKLPDLIVAAYPSPELAFVGAQVSRQRRVPFVIDIRDMWPDSFRGYVSGFRRLLLPPLIACYSLLYRYSLATCKLVLASSEAFLNGSKNYHFDPTVPHEVLYLGYPDTHARDWMPDTQPSNTLEVVFVSSFGKSYDGQRLINIAKKISPHKRDSIQFTFIGDGEYREEWERAAGNCACVRFIGWCDSKKLHEALSRSHVGVIFMHPHAQIPAPNKFFEYLCYGLAILNNVPGEMAAIVEQQQIGTTLTDSSDDLEAVQFLETLAEKRENLTEMRNRLRKLFVERYDSQVINQSYLEFIENTLDATPQK